MGPQTLFYNYKGRDIRFHGLAWVLGFQISRFSVGSMLQCFLLWALVLGKS